MPLVTSESTMPSRTLNAATEKTLGDLSNWRQLSPS